jgi:hypothetical protein
MTDNFANYPVSTSEVRANREEDCRLWSPRDALISILRDIDEGKVAPDALICIYRERGGDDSFRTHFAAASPDIHTSLGLLTRGQFKLME